MSKTWIENYEIPQENNLNHLWVARFQIGFYPKTFPVYQAGTWEQVLHFAGAIAYVLW